MRKVKKLDAYFTVEAVLVLPIVLMLVIFVMYLWFFQYDRCLLEQDTGMVALKGANLQEVSPQERICQVQDMINRIYHEKYLACEKALHTVKTKNGKVIVQGNVKIGFPFAGTYFGDDKSEWQIDTIYRNDVIEPVSLLRKYKRLKEGI